MNREKRTKSGRNTQQAGFFDLRENRPDPAAEEPEERPYRERHRVEVDVSGSRISGSRVSENPSSAGGELSEWPDLSASSPGEGYDRRERRVVRGNVPASRRGSSAGGRRSEEQPQYSGRPPGQDSSHTGAAAQERDVRPSGRGQTGASGRNREIRADMLEPGSSAGSGYRGNARTQRTQDGPGAARQQSRAGARADSARSTVEQGTRGDVWSTSKQSTRGDSARSTTEQGTRGDVWSTSKQSTRADNMRSTAEQSTRGDVWSTSKQSTRQNTRASSARSTAERRPRSDYPRYPSDSAAENSAERDREREAAAASAARRLRQRELARKKRERQLRRFYITAGACTLFFVILAVCLIRFALKKRDVETAGPAGQGTETVQTDAGTAGAADGSPQETAPEGTDSAKAENAGADTHSGEKTPGTETAGADAQDPAEAGAVGAGTSPGPEASGTAEGQEASESAEAAEGQEAEKGTEAAAGQESAEAAEGQEASESAEATAGQEASEGTETAEGQESVEAAEGLEASEGSGAAEDLGTGAAETAQGPGNSGTAAAEGPETDSAQAAEQPRAGETETAEGSGTGETNPDTESASGETVRKYVFSEQDTSDVIAAQMKELQGSSPAVGRQNFSRQDDWSLLVVNPWNRLPEGYTLETTTLPNGESVDSRCYSALTDMLDACRAAGGTPIVCSSYRPHEKQIGLYEDQVNYLISSGLPLEQAMKEAGTVVALPGTSEHELGLAVDICDSKNQLLDDSQADTPTQRWLMENCWNYGFILRYPDKKSEITGIIFEPWHYRYVGRDAAAEIHERGICLEEYLAP